MSQTYFLPPPVMSKNDDQPRSSGGLWQNATRRSFIKRTGGATVATLVAWNIATEKVRASVTENSETASKRGSKTNWLIRALAVGSQDSSTGSQVTWNARDVRKVLKLSISAEQTEFAGSATSVMSVEVIEWAEYYTVNDVWADMSPEMFAEYRGGSQDIHDTAQASITKVINSDTGEVTTTSKTAFGTTEGDPGYDNEETVSNIKIKLEWIGDTLKVTFGSSNVADESHSLEAAFETKATVIEQ